MSVIDKNGLKISSVLFDLLIMRLFLEQISNQMIFGINLKK